jgi:hypothetical protein
MQQQFDNQIALRDERTGRYVFNAQALKALGIDPAEARNRGYLLKDESGSAALSRVQVPPPQNPPHVERDAYVAYDGYDDSGL